MLGGSPLPTHALARVVLRSPSKWPTITTNLVATRSASKKSKSGSVPRLSQQVPTTRLPSPPASLPKAKSPGKTKPVQSAAPSTVSSPASGTTAASSNISVKTTTPPSGASSETPAQSIDNTGRSIRPIVLTGAIALIVAVGTVTGAILKQDTDQARNAQEFRELSIDDQVAMLRERRAYLVAQQAPLKRKLEDFRARAKATVDLKEAENKPVPE